MSLMYGLARLAAKLTPPTYNDVVKIATLKTFTKEVPEKAIEEAINDNNFELAEKNFKKIASILLTEAKAMVNYYVIESFKENDFKYILYLNKFPEKAIWYGKDYNQMWNIENSPSMHSIGNTNFGWQDTLKSVVGIEKLLKDKDFVSISLN